MVRKEDIVKIAEERMKNRENIRNIGIVAHIDHGKCISGETQIYFSNGDFERADNLFRNTQILGKLVKKTPAEEVYDVSAEDIKVFSFDKEKKSIVSKKITHAWELTKDKNLIKLTLSNGFSIKTTPEHKYLSVNKDGRIVEKQAKDIEEKEFVLTPKYLEPKSLDMNSFKKDFLEKLSQDYGFYVRIDERNSLEMRRRILEYGMKKLWSEIKSKIGSESFYAAVYKGRYRLKDFLGICRKLNYENPYDLILKLNYRKSIVSAWHSSNDISLPKTEQQITELMYLLGLIWGDGGFDRDIRITNEDQQLITAIKRIVFELFGAEAKVRKYQGKATRIDLGLGLSFSRIVPKIFDLPVKNKSASIRLPTAIKVLPNPMMKAFLQGYFDTDGTVETSRRAVSINSKSKEMLQDIYLALLRFGCISTSNEKKQTLYVSATNLKTFAEKVGFRLERKQKKLLKFAALSNNPNRNTDLMPLNTQLITSLRKELGIPLNRFSKSFEVIRQGLQQIYKTNFNEFINVVYSFIGNPKIKNRASWEKIQNLEKLFFDCCTLYVTKKEEVSNEKYVYDFTVEDTHNFIGNGVIIHNTTLTDSLVASCGLISKELAGRQLVMDYEDQEQERGITINAANISITHDHNNKQYLINLIDTPGHIDFGGDVIRAMRAVDGVVLVVDAVEGVMPQTETVVRQALKENVRPVLFINKIDRLVDELKLTEQQMQERFVKVISQVNNLIKKNCPEKLKDKWGVRVEDGSVVFGSGFHKWAVSVPRMKATNISFKDVFDYCKKDDQKTLSEKSPVHEAILEMVITHLPNPLEAQKYRIPKIWTGELESEIGKGMIECSKDAPLAMMITDVRVDKHAGDIATGRIYAGKVERGKKVKLIGLKKEVGLQKVGVFMGQDFVETGEVPAGNISAIIGLKEAFAGETISDQDMKEFESFMSTAEPVITISVEAKNTKDLPKLIEVIRQITKEDPNIVASINQETGEHLLSGMGELHLEITQYRIEKHHNVPIQVSQPIVVYNETITGESPRIEAKSPNKHNKFKIHVERIQEELQKKLVEAKIHGKIRPKDKHLVEKFIEIGFDREEAKRIWCVFNHSILVDATRGIQALHEIKELVIQGFEDAMKEGPLAKEKCFGVKFVLEDCTLHEDAIHRGPAQVLPAITRGIYACMLSADAILLEPKQLLTITVPQDYMGEISKLLGSRRAQIHDMRTEGDSSIIVGLAPVKELIGFSQAIRSATQGRAMWTGEYAGYEPLPRELQLKILREIRTRKGLPPEPRKAADFMD